MWQDACIIGQHGVWMHGVDVAHISFIMSSSLEMNDGSIRSQQALWFLGLHLREQGKICSHLLSNVAGGGDGTISLAIDDLEALPYLEVFHIFSSITRGFFDKEHVKEQSLVVTGAYLHELTALSLWNRDLWMECPQDHFTLYALGDQRGDQIDGEVDGDIYYIGMTSLAMIFLTWNSKYKEIGRAHV